MPWSEFFKTLAGFLIAGFVIGFGGWLGVVSAMRFDDMGHAVAGLLF